jgi:hypothetical protein
VSKVGRRGKAELQSCASDESRLFDSLHETLSTSVLRYPAVLVSFNSHVVDEEATYMVDLLGSILVIIGKQT